MRNNMGYNCQKLWDIFDKKLRGILGKNYGIYWPKPIGYIMGYI